jgi:mxaL protein
MAWGGNSEIAKGLYGSIAAAKSLPSHPAIVFFTDGQEAPPLDPRHRPPWNGQIGDAAGLLVGVGGDSPVPIPRHDPEGRAMGTWGAGDVVQRGNRGVNPNAPEAAEGPPPAMPGATPGQEHLSSLRESYLQLLATETGLGYHRLGDADDLRQAMLAPALAHSVEARISLRWPACGLALLLLLALHAGPAWLRVRALVPAWR